MPCGIPFFNSHQCRIRGFRPRNTLRGRPASVEYLLRQARHNAGTGLRPRNTLRGRPASVEYPSCKTWRKGIPTEECRRLRNTHRGRSASEEYPLRKVCYSSKNDTSGFARQLVIALWNTRRISIKHKLFVVALGEPPSHRIKCGIPIVEDQTKIGLGLRPRTTA